MSEILEESNISSISKWLDENKILNTRSVEAEDINKFINYINSIKIVYKNVHRKVSLLAMFIVTCDLMDNNDNTRKILNDIDLDSKEFYYVLENKLYPIYDNSTIISFIQACLYIQLPVYADGKMFVVFPSNKKQNLIIHKQDLMDIDSQLNIINKLDKSFARNTEKISVRMNMTEMKFVLSSYKHIIKNIRFESLLPKFLDLLKQNYPKVKINKALGINPYQYDQLVILAINQGMIDPIDVEKKKNKEDDKEGAKLQKNTVILSETNFSYITQVAASKFNGNTYQAVNAIISAMRDLQSKNVLDSNNQVIVE